MIKLIDILFENKKIPDEYIRKIAKKYEHKEDFRKGSPRAYGAAVNRGQKIEPKTHKRHYDYSFFEKVTSHMTPLGNTEERIIYVHEFTDDGKPVAAYIGLTYNSQKRYKQHIDGIDKEGNKKDTPVTKFIRENPTLKHKYKELTNFLKPNEAVKQEQFWEDKYRDAGWLILGKARPGSLGASRRIKDSDLKDFVNIQAKKGLSFSDLCKQYPNQVNRIYTRGLHKNPHNYFEKFDYTPNYTDESAFEKAMNYNSTSEIRNNDRGLYNALHKRKLIPKVEQAFEERDKDKVVSAT